MGPLVTTLKSIRESLTTITLIRSAILEGVIVKPDSKALKLSMSDKADVMDRGISWVKGQSSHAERVNMTAFFGQRHQCA